MNVEALMTTGVVCVRDADSVQQADEKMKIASVRHLPVVDAKNHVIGILSNRDLLPVGKNKKTSRVGAVMTVGVCTVRPDTPAADAADLMLDKKIGALPVVDDEEQLVGIVTETDFLRVARAALEK